MVVLKPKIIRKQKNKVNEITQKITDVHRNSVTVISRSGKEYHVSLSDRVKMTLNVEIGDTAIIKTFDNGWLVVDIIKKEKPKELSPEEEQAETERQIKEFEELLGGY